MKTEQDETIVGSLLDLKASLEVALKVGKPAMSHASSGRFIQPREAGAVLAAFGDAQSALKNTETAIRMVEERCARREAS